jgi:transcription elongation factor Elf1
MQLYASVTTLAGVRSFAPPVRCPHCGDSMVAPVVSEFVDDREIRHHWECDNCGESSTTAIALTTH